MTNHHTARPGEWADQENWACHDADSPCIIELRARIEALEVGQQKIRFGPKSPLVERVADAIAAQATSAGIVNDRPARAAILEVAAWLREKGYNTLQAEALAQEANR